MSAERNHQTIDNNWIGYTIANQERQTAAAAAATARRNKNKIFYEKRPLSSDFNILIVINFIMRVRMQYEWYSDVGDTFNFQNAMQQTKQQIKEMC